MSRPMRRNGTHLLALRCAQAHTVTWVTTSPPVPVYIMQRAPHGGGAYMCCAGR